MAEKTRMLKFLAVLHDQLSKPLLNVRKNLKLFQRAAGDVTGNLKTLGAMAMVPMGAAAAGAAAIVKSSVSSMVAYGGAVDDASRSLSIASDALQGFRYAAAQSGSSAEEMDGAIAMLNKNIANAAAGKNKQLVSLFKALGISMRDANGHMKTAAELMPEVADAIARQKDGTQRAYIATQLFGRSGQNLIKLLKGGAAGLAEQRAEAEKFGVIMSQDAVAAATAFGDSMTRNKYAIQGLQNSIGEKLLPVLQPMLDSFNDWIAENREWIATDITDAVKDLAASLKGIDFKGAVQGAISFAKAAFNLFEKLGGLKTVAIAVGGLFASKLVLTIGSTAVSVLKLVPAVISLNAALWACPVTWIIGALVAIGVAVYELWKHWDEVAAWIEEKWQEVKNFLSTAARGIVIGLSAAWKIISGAFGAVADSIEAKWQAVKDFFSTAGRGMALGVTAAFTVAKDFLTETVPNAVKSVWQGVADWFKGIFDKIMAPIDAITNAASGIADTVSNAAGGAWNSVKDFLNIGDKKKEQPISPGSRGDMARAQVQTMQSTIDVNLHADPGTDASVAKARGDADGVKVHNDKGKTR